MAHRRLALVTLLCLTPACGGSDDAGLYGPGSGCEGDCGAGGGSRGGGGPGGSSASGGASTSAGGGGLVGGADAGAGGADPGAGGADPGAGGADPGAGGAAGTGGAQGAGGSGGPTDCPATQPAAGDLCFSLAFQCDYGGVSCSCLLLLMLPLWACQ
jgi:hypothetical protein